jgi:hypothetical protein
MKTILGALGVALLTAVPAPAQTDDCGAISGSLVTGTNTIRRGEPPAPSTTAPYVPFISFRNPFNGTNVMQQWEVLESLLITNRIRLGIMMGSMYCGQPVHRDDKERATALVQDALRRGLIDIRLLDLKIEETQPRPAPYH